MRSHMVVPAAKLEQLASQVVTISDQNPIQPAFQRAEEPLDAAVLPGTMQFHALMLDAEQ